MKFKEQIFVLKRILVCGLLCLTGVQSYAQVPKPATVFGFEPGADYKIADFEQMQTYFTRLAQSSKRVKMVEIGKSVQGKPLLLLFISSEENIAKLEDWRKISEQLSRAKIPAEEAAVLAEKGKAIVWIDAGLHASEKACAQMMPELAYRLVSEETSEYKKIRDNVITLLMPVMNPDGLDIVADWYKAQLKTPFENTSPPWLWHPYIGHDNNRDWFMNNMPESKAVSEVLYKEWYPQIVYNHHQSSPPWTRIFIPPFASPVNPNIPADITASVNLLGSAMSADLAFNNKPGVISQLTYDMWWNGGMRTVPYYHNQVGLLTEVAHTSPSPAYFDPAKLPATVGSGVTMRTDGTEVFYSNPWKGGTSHFRDPIDYMLITSMAVLKTAADRRPDFLRNIYQMGRNAILNKDSVFAYVIPAIQWDKGEALNLVNLMMQSGVEVFQSKAVFNSGSATYPAGSYLIYAAQSFYPYVKDLMEKQVYPDMRVYPGGPPLRPYDLAGWTLPMQMGVKVDKAGKPFTVAQEQLQNKAVMAAGQVAAKPGYGYVFTHHENAGIIAVNRLLKDGEQLSIAEAGFTDGNNSYAAGAFVLKNSKSAEAAVTKLAKETGLDFEKLDVKPSVPLKTIKKIKVGIYKSWVANMDEGWTRWLLQQYAFTVDTLHDEDLLHKDLSGYNALIIPDQTSLSILNGHKKGSMPAPYTGGIGKNGVAVLAQYMEQGGTVVTFDAASDFAVKYFKLPLKNVTSGLTKEQFYIPGSLIRMDVNVKDPIAYGMQPVAAASFNNSRAYEVAAVDSAGVNNDISGVNIIASYAKKELLMSGWALNADQYISGKAAVLRVKKGKGNVVLFAFSPQFRGQPRATYKLFFNALFGFSTN